MHYYWSLNPKQWEKHLKVFNKQEESRLREKDYFNYILGKYIAYSFNDPKNYPKSPFTETINNKSEFMTDEQMEQMVRRNTLRLGGAING